MSKYLHTTILGAHFVIAGCELGKCATNPNAAPHDWLTCLGHIMLFLGNVAIFTIRRRHTPQ